MKFGTVMMIGGLVAMLMLASCQLPTAGEAYKVKVFVCELKKAQAGSEKDPCAVYKDEKTCKANDSCKGRTITIVYPGEDPAKKIVPSADPPREDR